MRIVEAFYLIVAVLGNSLGRAAVNTGMALSIHVKETVCIRVLDFSGAGWQNKVSNNTSTAVGDTAFGNKAIGKAEGAESGGISNMSFRPV